MDVKLLEKYVDDCFAAPNKLSPGIRWDEDQKAMIWNPEKDKEVRESNNLEEKTMKEFSKIASVINTGNNQRGEGMPVLDIKCWMGQEQRQDGINPDIIPKNIKSMVP